MKLINKDNIPIADTFISLFGDALAEVVPHFDRDITFRILREDENDYHDILGRIGRTIYISPEEVGKIGLTDNEVLAAIAHEIGHIVYHTHAWQPDCEERADMLAAQLGLGSQMITAIEKLLESRRYGKLTSMLVGRIHYLQNMLRGA